MSENIQSIVKQTLIEKVDRWANAYVQVSSLSKKTVELCKVLEGDLWHIEAFKATRRYKIQSAHLVEPAKERVEPKCPHFHSCGGCQWQHEPVDLQLKRKQAWAVACLSSCAGPYTIWHEPIATPKEWYYRNKMEFSFGQFRDGQKFLGLHQSRSRVFNITDCQIAPKWFNCTLDHVRHWWQQTLLNAYDFRKDSGSLRSLMLRSSEHGHNKMAVLTVSGNPQFALTQDQIYGFKKAVLDSLELLGETQVSIYLNIHQCIQGKPSQFFEIHLHGPDSIQEHLHIEGKTFTFSISPTTFFQPNTLAAERLYAAAMRLLEIKPHECVWDLFCGSGTLAIIASKLAKEVIGVEINPMAVLDAKANAAANGCLNIKFECADLHKGVKEVFERLKQSCQPDCVMVDPPRAGLLDKGADLLAQLGATKILYISCSPQTQATDILRLKAYGYVLEQVQIVDQFAHTGHIESVCLLVKR